nr:DNA sulfur modification protein DndB [Pectobacterium sp. CFBP8739]
MTSFSVDDLAQLSYSKDINTDLNFDYLIQRDIDEERARVEISQYISSSEDRVQKDIVFLPPLLVSIVNVDSNNKLIDYYPNCSLSSTDDNGLIFERVWPSIFKIRNFEIQNGKAISVKYYASEIKDEVITIDINQAIININSTREGVAGARLVVIDGQHRLFALNYLRKEHPDKIKNIVVPVCIVYSPYSTLINSTVAQVPTIPEVLRNLFVDINSTVERVSGHFLTLLSDRTLGSIICREFCKKILSERQGYGLGLIEWNTKKHKESLEISRDYTITSIGVINNILEDCFGTRNGIKILTSILGIRESATEFDFSEFESDEDDEENIVSNIPETFPWSGFLSKHKPILTKLVNETLTKTLVTLFFETKFFADYYDNLRDFFEEQEAQIKSNRSCESGVFYFAKNHILLNDPETKKSLPLINELISELKSRKEKIVPSLASKSICHKAMVEAWFLLCSKIIVYKKDLKIVDKIIQYCVESAFSPNVQLFNEQRLFIQDTIYINQRIKVTKVARRQIVRLFFSQLLLKANIERLVNDLKIDNELQGVLIKFAKSEVGAYLNQMSKDKTNTFIKTFRSNYNLDDIDRDKLLAAEANRTKEIKQKNASEVYTEFDDLVKFYTKEGIVNAYQDLTNCLKSNDFDFSFDNEPFDDEI